MTQEISLKAAHDAFDQIGRIFPRLRIVEDLTAPVEISLTVPTQPGVKYVVWLALQNRDELHFSVENFWMEWFPCTDASKVKAFVDAVTGYLSGRSRVLEHYRGTKCVKAELQSFDDDEWCTIATWSRLHFPVPLRKSFKEIRNT